MTVIKGGTAGESVIEIPSLEMLSADQRINADAAGVLCAEPVITIAPIPS
jgi:hypothetical protein